MLELKSITWQNFLSYGDYPTTLNLNDLGQCLITGEVEGDEKEELNSTSPIVLKKSNGAGKSTIPSVIQWVLFGRTMHSHNPGNNIVNWYTGKDCWAKLEFKNGDSITRTRNTDGKNELIYYKDGDERRLVSDTLATSSLQQQQLNKDFNLDWELFCGSVFFNQYGKPWMEMADATRKKAIERILHVDRFTYYAQAAKEKCDNLDKLVEKMNLTISSMSGDVERYKTELERLIAASDNYTTNQQERYNGLINEIKTEKERHDSIEVPDIEKLKLKWDLIVKIKEKIEEKRRQYNSINSSISEKSGTIKSIQARIDLWVKRAGKVCTSCEQPIDCAHTDTKVSPLNNELSDLQTQVEDLKKDLDATKSAIGAIEILLKDKTPTMTLLDAQSIVNNKIAIANNIAKLKERADKIKDETNPYKKSIDDLSDKLNKVNEKIESSQAELTRSELLNKHYHYVYKAYNDRNKIKSYVFKEHIPFINSRLKHYMDTFGLDVKISLTESLSVESNMWGYEFESGGERKRTDVAFMLAMFDFHEQMYGRQCNVLVLDEVDGRMDDDGIDSLISVIKNDLANRVETILVISHRNLMFDTFPKEIKVVRTKRQSRLEVY